MRRIAVPYTVTLIVLNFAIGLVRVLEGPVRTQSTAYKYAKHLAPHSWGIAPLHLWGLAFLGVALLLFVASYSTDPVWIRSAACAGFFLWICWAGLVLTAAVRDGKSSFVGPILYFAIAGWHFQVIRRR